MIVSTLSTGGKTYYTTTVTLTAAGWSNYEQTVSATGVTTSNLVIVSPVPSDTAEYVDSFVVCTTQLFNALTFTCASMPANDIDVEVAIFG